jgi:carbamoyl-phosphate synthase large subunit
MKNKTNILVTGCGGDIGQSIGKILKESSYVQEIYGCDISEKNAAKFIYKNFFLGLPYTNDNYLINLEKVIVQNNIDIVMPVSEPELRYFSRVNILDNIGPAKMVTASKRALEIGFDKYETAMFLEKEQLPFPETFNIESVNSVKNFPVVLKSRTGSGSSNVHIVNDQESFLFIQKNNPDYVIQEYLEGDKGEFTCGVFRSKQGIIRTIILKRELMGGFSGYGEVSKDNEIEEILIQIATKLELEGSINVQLRVTKKGPVVFEINPRFSSTVRFRDLFGFQDVIWSIEDKLDLPISDYNIVPSGRKFFKGFNEYIS